MAGNVVERAVGNGLQKLHDVVERIPKLTEHIGFEPIDPTQDAKKDGDFKTDFNGRTTIIDVTFKLQVDENSGLVFAREESEESTEITCAMTRRDSWSWRWTAWVVGAKR